MWVPRFHTCVYCANLEDLSLLGGEVGRLGPGCGYDGFILLCTLSLRAALVAQGCDREGDATRNRQNIAYGLHMDFHDMVAMAYDKVAHDDGSYGINYGSYKL